MSSWLARGNGLHRQNIEEGTTDVLMASFYIINTKGKDIDIQVLADGKELFSVVVPYKGGVRVPEKGPAIINGPDAKLIEDLEMKLDTKILKVIEKNSGMEGAFSCIDFLRKKQGLTIEVKRDHIQIREGIDLPD
jgi:hypothetical protein